MNGEHKDYESVMYYTRPVFVDGFGCKIYLRELDISYWFVDPTRITAVPGILPDIKCDTDGEPYMRPALPVGTVEVAALQRILAARAALEAAEKDAVAIFNKVFQEKSA